MSAKNFSKFSFLWTHRESCPSEQKLDEHPCEFFWSMVYPLNRICSRRIPFEPAISHRLRVNEFLLVLNFNKKFMVFSVNFFGQNCDVYCQLKDWEIRSGRFECSPLNGLKRCKNGWSGQNCSESGKEISVETLLNFIKSLQFSNFIDSYY